MIHSDLLTGLCSSSLPDTTVGMSPAPGNDMAAGHGALSPGAVVLKPAHKAQLYGHKGTRNQRRACLLILLGLLGILEEALVAFTEGVHALCPL